MSFHQVTQERARFHPRGISAIKNFNVETYRKEAKKRGKGDDFALDMALDRLAGLGIVIEKQRLEHTFDAIQQLVTTPSITVPIQFLQAFSPGYVFAQTGLRNADEFMGVSVLGTFFDEQIIQGILERAAKSQPYGDYVNIALANLNVNYVSRSIVRFEVGMEVGILEAGQASRVNLDVSGGKRSACAQQLEIVRNSIAFFGYNGGLNRTYGFLNEPQLSAYVTVATGASSSTLWANKTMLEIVKDIRVAIAGLRASSKGLVDPKKLRMRLAVPTACVDFLSNISDLGYSVLDWLQENYPNITVVSAPQLDAANGGANVFYLYPEEVDDESTDDKRVWIQAVPAKSYMLGVQQGVKNYVEGFANALAGAILKRPWAVARYTGI